MKEYKRLTMKCEVGIGLTETSGNIVNDYEKVVNRLAELEDKIENGTLKFLQCKVGDTFYEIDTLYCGYRKHEVGGFTIENGELILIDDYFRVYKASEVCFSQAEAEEKLKELQSNE